MSKPSYHLRLFVVGQGSTSTEAINNLEKIKSDGFADARIEVIDATKEPELALKYMVLATPMLIRESPEPKVTIIGSLSDTEKVVAALKTAG